MHRPMRGLDSAGDGIALRLEISKMLDTEGFYKMTMHAKKIVHGKLYVHNRALPLPKG